MSEKEHSDLDVNVFATLHREGSLAQAEEGYRALLDIDPSDYNANQLLATLLQQRGEINESRKHYEIALNAGSDDPSCRSNYGSLLLSTGELEEAIEQFALALKSDPRHFDALRNQALAFERLERFGEAQENLAACVQLKPSVYDVWIHKGLCESKLSKFAQAGASFGAGILLDPNQHQGYAKYGELLMKQGFFPEAVHYLQQAIDTNPIYLNSRMLLANCHFLAHDYQAALTTLEDAFSLAKDNSISAQEKTADWTNKRTLTAEESKKALEELLLEGLRLKAKNLILLGNRDLAIDVLGEALEIAPNDAESLAVRAQQNLAIKRFDLAEQDLEQLMSMGEEENKPLLLGELLIAYRGGFKHEKATQLQPSVINALGEEVLSVQPFPLLSISDSAELQLQCATLHKNSLENINRISRRSAEYPSRAIQRAKGEPIRVAYVSPDFRHHPVAFLTKGIFEQHDRTRFEVIGVTLHHTDNIESKEIAASCDHWIDASSMAAGPLLDQMRKLELDIAVDLAGYTARSRPVLFAQRIAPVQINFLGFPGTTGRSYMDYIIGDSAIIPRPLAQYYSEKVMCLDPCFQPNDERRENHIVKFSRASQGLPEDTLLFACNNRAEKISPEILRAWISILKSVDNSGLWFLGIGNTQLEELKSVFAAEGVDASRLYGSPRVPYSQNLSRMKNADLMLDTHPFNGGTSTSEALWVGVPVLTLSGQAFASRMSASLLQACGLESLCTTSLDDYTELAIKLGRNPEQLTAIKKHLKRSRQSAQLFDTASFTTRLENAYEQAVARSRRGFKPQHIGYPE